MTDVDTDYDGRSDAEERAENTDPLRFSDRLGTRLAYFRFNTPDWKGEEGQLPLSASGSVSNVSSFDGNAASFTTTGAELRYRCVEGNGVANLNLTNGGVRLRFRPNWTSPVAGGSGSGASESHLLVIGDRVNASGNGFLELNIVTNGNMMRIRSSRNGTGPPNTVTWDSGVLSNSAFKSNVWTEILLSLEPTQITVWKDQSFVLQTTNNPMASGAARTNGFYLGSYPGGLAPCNGAIDEVECFNSRLGAFSLYEGGNTAYAEAVQNPTALRLHWRRSPRYETTKIERRIRGSGTNWTTLNSGNATPALQFTDTGITVGTLYDYRLTELGPSLQDLYLPGLVAAVEAPPVLSRGKVLMLVDNTLASSLQAELSQYSLDLVGDGWQVLSNSVARHDDTTWSANTNNIRIIKQSIQSTYGAHTNLKLLVLVGHVAVPYTGMAAEDGHQYLNDNHFGAWSSDLYYADMDGVWTNDALPYQKPGIPVRFGITTNIVGDGKFDHDFIPADPGGLTNNIELGVGRIDFANLHYLSTSPGNLSELALLKRYFKKNHRYRLGLTSVLNRGIGRNFSEPPLYSSSWNMVASWGSRPGHRTLSSLYPAISERFVEGDFLAETNRLAYLWCHQFGYGDVDRLRAAHPTAEYLASKFAYPERQPKAVIGMFFGSWFGDWNLSQNNFLRSFLGVPDYGLAAMWGADQWPITEFSFGGSLGELQANSYQYWRDHEAKSEIQAAPRRWFNLLGDPALRWTPTRTPQSLTGMRIGGEVSLSWIPGSTAEVRYFVFRSTAGLFGPYGLVGNTNGTLSTVYVDTGPPAGSLHYQLRSSELSTSGSGSFWNPSQSLFITLH